MIFMDKALPTLSTEDQLVAKENIRYPARKPLMSHMLAGMPQLGGIQAQA